MTVALALPAVAIPMVGAGGTMAVTVMDLAPEAPTLEVTAILIVPAALNSAAGNVTCADVRVAESAANVCAPTTTDTGE